MSALEKMLAPLKRRVMSMVGRFVVKAVEDSGGIQVLQVQLLNGELRTIQRVQEFGFTSTPPAGAEGVAGFVGGNRDHGVALGVDDRRHRPTDTPKGGSQLFAVGAARVKVNPDGTVEIIAPANQGLRVTAPLLELDGDLIAGGNIADEPGAHPATPNMAMIRQVVQQYFNAHTHTTPAGPSGPPQTPMVL